MATPMMAGTIHFDDDILALTLQLEEMEAQRERQTGKWHEDSLPDLDVAFLDFETELEKAIQLMEDLKAAHSVAEAVDPDAANLWELNTEEFQAHQDRTIAFRPQDDEAENPGLAAIINNNVMDDDSVLTPSYLSALSEKVKSIFDSITSSFSSPSSPYAIPQEQVLQQLHHRKLECVVCSNQFYSHETITLDCIGRHVYCKDCLKELFLLSIKDESVFPPTCCGSVIPVSLIQDTFTSDESEAFHDAEVEYSSPKRVYCAHPQCGCFLSMPAGVDDRAYCGVCGNETCVHCNREAHEGDCLADHALQQFLRFAAEQNWQRCYRCRGMVERPEGCDHITCRCGAEFCYICGTVWKHCSCGGWEPEETAQ